MDVSSRPPALPSSAKRRNLISSAPNAVGCVAGCVAGRVAGAARRNVASDRDKRATRLTGRVREKKRCGMDAPVEFDANSIVNRSGGGERQSEGILNQASKRLASSR